MTVFRACSLDRKRAYFEMILSLSKAENLPLLYGMPDSAMQRNEKSTKLPSLIGRMNTL